MRRPVLYMTCCVALFVSLTNGCHAGATDSCADLRRELDALSVKTRDATQTWQNTKDLEKTVTRMEQIKASLASECSAGS